MSWDDSFMCTAAYPNLTAMGRDVVDTGKQAAGLLLKLIDGERVGHSDRKGRTNYVPALRPVPLRQRNKPWDKPRNKVRKKV
mgnify:CR=1 FL=1